MNIPGSSGGGGGRGSIVEDKNGPVIKEHRQGKTPQPRSPVVF